MEQLSPAPQNLCDRSDRPLLRGTVGIFVMIWDETTPGV